MFNRTSTACVMIGIAIVLIIFFGIKNAPKKETEKTTTANSETKEETATDEKKS